MDSPEVHDDDTMTEEFFFLPNARGLPALPLIILYLLSLVVLFGIVSVVFGALHACHSLSLSVSLWWF